MLLINIVIASKRELSGSVESRKEQSRDDAGWLAWRGRRFACSQLECDERRNVRLALFTRAQAYTYSIIKSSDIT